MTNINDWTNKERTTALFSLRFSHNLNEEEEVKSHAQPYFNEWLGRYNEGIDSVKAHADNETLKAVREIEKAEKELSYSEFMRGE